MALLPVDEALSRMLDGAEPLSAVEMVPLAGANGRVLARDLAAMRTQPPFPASAMDGYAVRAADIDSAPADLTLVGQSAAGHGFSGSVEPGQTVRIFTGAPLPHGADTVLIQENAESLDGSRVRALDATPEGKHVRAAGLDFREGDTQLFAGDRLDAGRLTLAAAMNYATVPVFRRPLVALIATGDELVQPGERPGPDQIIASNTAGIGALVRQSGGTVADLGIAGDTSEALSDAADRAEALDADVIVTIGGASVGDHDLVRSALGERGLKLDFWRIAMRPGKPLMFGRLGGRRLVGLPGNPVSGLVCAHLFLVPLVRRLAGMPDHDAMRPAVLGAAMNANDERQDYVRASLRRGENGDLVATPFERQDSSMTRLFAQAEALIVRPPRAPAAQAGEKCAVFVLRVPEATA